MTINKEIIIKLKKSKVNTNLALYYLFSLWHGLDVCVSRSVVRQVNLLGIVDVDYEYDGLKWTIPLYEESTIPEDWTWVNDFVELFKSANKSRKGNVKTCVTRLKKVMSEYDISKEDVIGVAELYINGCNDYDYLKTSHKFIYEGPWSNKNSMLLSFYEEYKERNELFDNDRFKMT